jgi:hypothetical protein
MGFFSDLMKNPFVQMALPMGLSWAMPHLGITSMLGGIKNPMIRSAIEQTMLGYGTAKLTGSKHPEKAAMYAGLGSMPFSFMKAQGAADVFNKQYAGAGAADLYKTDKYITEPAKMIRGAYTSPAPGAAGMTRYNPATFGEPTYGYRIPEGLKAPEKLTAWDVLKGKEYNIPATRDVDTLRRVHMIDPKTEKAMFNPKTGEPLWDYQTPWEISGEILDPTTVTPADDVNFYSKIGKGQKNLLGQELTKGETFTDWLPTIASQTTGWYGGRPTSEELWDDAKKRRRKELAFMYGIPEDMLGGEMENPYYTGGGFWKDGGIASLQMDAGGAVNGPGGPKDDVIDAKLSDGEFVMTAKAVENLGGGNRLAGAKQMYNMMNQLDPQSETVQESVIGV